jgi:Family of unknown function (DUF5684)
MTSLIQFPLHSFATVFAQDVNYSYSSAGQISPIWMVCYALFVLLMIASMWKVFAKAGEPGWAAIVPIYNIIVWCKIVGRPAWWIILLFIPCVNFVILIMLCIDLAKSFGKDAGFGIGLVLLGIVFFPMLGFGSAQYVGPAASTAARPIA